MRFSQISFSKWHALGNSYLLVERADLGRPVEPDDARRLCDVRYGIGADGVLEVVSAEGASAEVAIWNPDGSPAEFSGNGTRIAAVWLARRGGNREVAVTISGREYRATTRGTEIELEIGPVEVHAPEAIDLGEERIELTRVSVGNPHAVVQREIDRDELLRLGPLIERHGRFADRTNVQLVAVEGRHDVSALVWERGAGETSASGSSAVAVAAAAIANGWCESPVAVHMPGGDLGVTLDGANRATLTGPAEPICTGQTVA
ncbi:MAG: diaminopimelate epimerase [Gaiellaceae bacterium MAG52_C11]|nr:diaminopimelate epimerase [Candidatus Gaiellasilicea maunaloa]